MDFTFHRETKLTKQLKSIQKITVRPKEKGGGRAIAPEYATVFIYRSIARQQLYDEPHTVQKLQ